MDQEKKSNVAKLMNFLFLGEINSVPCISKSTGRSNACIYVFQIRDHLSSGVFRGGGHVPPPRILKQEKKGWKKMEDKGKL